MPTVVELPVTAYKGPVDPDWCPGCGDFGVLRGLQRAAGKLGIQPKDLLVVSASAAHRTCQGTFMPMASMACMAGRRWRPHETRQPRSACGGNRRGRRWLWHRHRPFHPCHASEYGPDLHRDE